MSRMSPLALVVLAAVPLVGCGGSEGGEASCDAPTTDLAVEEGFEIRLTGGESGGFSSESEVGWFNLNGDVSISMGNDLETEEPSLYLFGLSAAEGVQCASGARMELGGVSYLNGSSATEDFDVGGSSFAVEVVRYEEDVVFQAVVAGTFTETAGGPAQAPVDVEAAFAADLDSGF